MIDFLRGVIDFLHGVIDFLHGEHKIAALILGILASAMGLSLFLIHSHFVNPYLKNQNTLLTSAMLPTIALIITKAIASNFFLSLGLIGALSIIRYRTPVKSMYELTLLFCLISIGVVGGVNIAWAFGLFVFISLIAPLFHLLKKWIPTTFGGFKYEVRNCTFVC